MPPANSPSETPIPRSPPTSSVPPLTRLLELETRIPTLAASLSVQTGTEDADSRRTHNSSIRDQMDARMTRRRRSLPRSTDDSDRWLRERLIARNRATNSPARVERTSSGRERMNPTSGVGSYGDRLPHWQSLYDWAPAGEEGGDASRMQNRATSRSSTRLASPSATVNIPPMWMSSTPPPLRSLRTPEETTPAERSQDPSNANPSSVHESTMEPRRPMLSTARASRPTMDPPLPRPPDFSDLRTQAIAQSIRRHPLAQRSQVDEASREQLRQARLVRPPSMVNASDRRRQSADRDLGSIVDVYRQHYLQDPSGTLPPRLGPFEEVIQYLNSLRSVTSDEHAEHVAIQNKTVRQALMDLSARANDTPVEEDFVFNVDDVAQPPESSWLMPGSTFEGSQHATRSAVTRRVSPTHDPSSSAEHPLSDSTVHPPDARNPRSPSHPQTFTVTDPTSGDHYDRPTDHSSTRNNTNNNTSKREDTWPVRVTIHAVDYTNMTISGEMEAFNVPDGRSPEGNSITTYLEGEIIDFHNHTLETKNYSSSAMTDGTYWKKLMPFRAYWDDDTMLARNMLSKKWLAEHISQEWILMRWKEKHFLHPSDQRLGLTISGFYYVSLRRSDGFVEGLYFDPSSTPYQHLVLSPPGNGPRDAAFLSTVSGTIGRGRRWQFPAYEFR
ncbi:MAG: hypothetical protein M4579_003083 [Chaenotheca gracillima]|nr:MAG: hypothetical protein M4579_003083 [Chaenotheca gracillima]